MKKFTILSLIAVVLLIGGVWWSNSATVSDDPTIISRDGIHWHPQVEIYVQDEKQVIPENVGLVGGHNPIHTHNDLPVIHLEFEGIVRVDDVRLGNFFNAWGKSFSSTQLLEHTGEVQMFVNGEPNTEFESYIMQDNDKIELHI